MGRGREEFESTKRVAVVTGVKCSHGGSLRSCGTLRVKGASPPTPDQNQSLVRTTYIHAFVHTIRMSCWYIFLPLYKAASSSTICSQSSGFASLTTEHTYYLVSSDMDSIADRYIAIFFKMNKRCQKISFMEE